MTEPIYIFIFTCIALVLVRLTIFAWRMEKLLAYSRWRNETKYDRMLFRHTEKMRIKALLSGIKI